MFSNKLLFPSTKLSIFIIKSLQFCTFLQGQKVIYVVQIHAYFVTFLEI